MVDANMGLVPDYDAMFARRMEMAGITPNDRIAIAVSGGADSMALCLLTIKWFRLQKIVSKFSSVDMITGMVVDHGLRPESSMEAICVQNWVLKLGIDCRVLKCDLDRDMLSRGHLQVAARLARYSRLEEACKKNDIKFLLTAHHADDQDELFVLRLSRHSGVAGLAGMAYITELFQTQLCCKHELKPRLMLVRPVLQFRKQDLYKICQVSGQTWVEDATNQNLYFARNRIRKFLKCTPFSPLKNSLKHLIAECRKARAQLDESRDKVLSESVLVDQEYGFATIQVKKFILSSVDEVILSRTLATILQFIAQREKPPRGRVLKAALNWICSDQLEGAFTASGCYLAAKPGSKGSQVLVTFSPESPQPSRYRHMKDIFTDECRTLSSCITQTKVNMDFFSINFFDSDSRTSLTNVCDSIESSDWFKRPKAMGLVSEDAAHLLAALSTKLSEDLKHHLHGMDSSEITESGVPGKKKHGFSSIKEKQILTPGNCKYVMDRYKVSWWEIGSAYCSDCMSCKMLPSLNERPFSSELLSQEANSQECYFWSNNRCVEIRHFEEKDFSYLSEIAKGEKAEHASDYFNGSYGLCFHQVSSSCSDKGNFGKQTGQHQALSGSYGFKGILDGKSSHELVTSLAKPVSCGEYMVLRAKEAISLIKLIPRPVIRGVPVFIGAHGVLLAIPSLRFQCCLFRQISAKFSPRIPLGGGVSSWL